MLEMGRRQKFRVRDKTLGVVGVGHVGSRVVRNAEALGMRVLANDPPRARAERLKDFVPLEQICAEADIITTHVPLTREGAHATFHLFDKNTLSALEERKPILMNTARGGVVDNQVLLKAVDGERVSGVVLDVWENEPNISPELLELVDIGTPHIAGYSFDGKVNGTSMIYSAMCKFFGIEQQWQTNLPPPDHQRVVVRCQKDDDDEDVLRSIIEGVYPILVDDRALRTNIRGFDRLRAEYPIRREFFNFRLALDGARESLLRKLAAIGFVLG
jgi:erythronate-4-phosphate dehydrogenase